jgi:preprotein translocase subunit SecA
MTGKMFEEFNSAARRDQRLAWRELAAALKTKFGYALQAEAESPEMKNPELLEKKILLDLNGEIDEKENLVGPAWFNEFIRQQYLRAVDLKWLDHLENMEALREAVYLRSYAQKNPLTEYKVEGFQIFDTMIDEIRMEIASRLHLVRIQVGENREARPPRPSATIQSASHGTLSSFGEGAASGESRSPGNRGIPQGSQPGGVTVVRAHPKVGRNDPCPCGSGKKYKHCHGR